MTESAKGAGRFHRPTKRALVIGLLLAGAVGLALSTWFATTRPDLPPLSDLETVTQLVATGKVDSLALEDSTLIVRERDGSAVRVERITASDLERLAATADESLPRVSVTANISAGQDLGYRAGFVASLALPLVVVVAIGVVFVGAVGRGWPRSFGSR